MKRFLPLLALCLAASLARPALCASDSPRTLSPSSRVETLPNGLQFVTSVARTSPRVALSLQVRVGASDETAANAGWRRLFAGAVSRGIPVAYKEQVPTDDGLGLTRLAESAGGEAGVNVGDDYLEFYAVGDSAHATQMLDLLIAMWQSPRLSDADINGAKKRLSDQLDAQDLDIAAQTNAALRAQEFVNSAGEPVSYGLSDIGTTTSLPALTPDKVRELGRRVAGANATLSAVGDVDLSALRARLSTLPAPKYEVAPTPQFRALSAGKPALLSRDLPVPAAFIFISYRLGRVSAQDAPVFRLLSAALSDVPDARLTKRLLSAPGGGIPQAISLASQFVARRDGSELLITAQTSPQRVPAVTRAILQEVARLREAPLSAKEFAAARDFALGDWALNRQSPRDRALLGGQSLIVANAPDDLWPRYLASATPSEAQALAKKSLRSYASVFVAPK